MKVIEAKVAAAAMKHSDQASAAKEVGLSTRQFREIMRREPVKAELRLRGRELLHQTMLALAGSGHEAHEVLVAIAKDPKAKVSARVSAARAVIELGQRGAELADLEGLLDELEQGTNAPKGGRSHE